MDYSEIKNQKIQFNKPFLPPIEEYESYLNEVWERGWLTNNGPLVSELEHNLRLYLGVKHLSYVTNGTIALQIAIQSLQLKDEIITTPFSYVATTSSIVWEGCLPVFVDIDPHTLNIDPEKIEDAITSQTTAILATHLFGNPCNVDAIAQIANEYNLKVIYDGAQGFGSIYKGKSIFNYGDISTVSFHATKLFQTVEGGGIITRDENLIERVNFMRNFGHDGPEKFNGVGVNGKNSELHAAMGLCNLQYIEEILSVRKKQCEIYDDLLNYLHVAKPKILPEAEINYAYYPLIFESEAMVLEIQESLERENIFPRRYFYPSLSQLNYVKKQSTPIANDIASRILCLPLYHTLTETEQLHIAEILLSTTNSRAEIMFETATING